jgi:hypothetical protein
LAAEFEGHEFDDRPQAGHRRANADAGEAVFGDGRVDDALGAEFLQQVLRDLVGALVFGDLLAHHEDLFVTAHLLGHGVAQGLAHRHRDELRAGGIVRLVRHSALLRGGRGLGGSLGRRGVGGFALGDDHPDGRVHRHIVGALVDEDRAERALVDGLDLHCRLVGLDFGEHVT